MKLKTLKAAFPYTIPIFAGFWFLGLAYGIYMNVSGFGFWYPMLMSLTIFGGSLEFVAVTMLFAPFGQAVGFPEKSADVRLAQYETGTRTPKAGLTVALAQVLDVSPQALSVPDIDSCIGLMHTLFTLEDNYGLTVSEADEEVCLKVNNSKGKDAAELLKMLYAWKEQADKLSSEEISKEEYDRWRYYYPKYDTTQLWTKAPSQELGDTMIEAVQNELNDI